jgi:hypothetical protein
MAIEPLTFRDHFLSLYQSAIGQVVRSGLDAAAAAPGLASGMVRAATQIATMTSQGQTIPTTAPPNMSQDNWTVARLALALLQAKVAGDTVREQQINDELRDGGYDPNWVNTIAEFVQHFGADGSRGQIPYIPPDDSMHPLPMSPTATVALIADWGTGTASAINLLKGVAQQKPDILIHLGDIYYSGTPFECQANFKRIVDDVFGRTGADTDIPVFTMPGNHDMYSGGEGYYGLLKTLNPPEMRQAASFFCLRDTAEQRWQFVAMDTGLHDYDPFKVGNVLTFLEQPEEKWLAARIAEFPGKTILLSHHQLFSAFAQIGSPTEDGFLVPYNPSLAMSFQRFQAAGPGRIAAWFWGHEHTLTLYGPYRGLDKGRCIGHGGVPVLTGAGSTELTKLLEPPPFLNVALGIDDHIYAHGFAIVRFLGDGSATASYYQDIDYNQPMYTETL